MKTVLLLNVQIYCLMIRLKQLYFVVERAIVGIGFRMITFEVFIEINFETIY